MITSRWHLHLHTVLDLFETSLCIAIHRNIYFDPEHYPISWCSLIAFNIWREAARRGRQKQHPPKYSSYFGGCCFWDLRMSCGGLFWDPFSNVEYPYVSFLFTVKQKARDSFMLTWRHTFLTDGTWMWTSFTSNKLEGTLERHSSLKSKCLEEIWFK